MIRGIINRINGGIKVLLPSEKELLIIKELWAQKLYWPPEFEVKDNYVIIDIGAHIGCFSIACAKKAKHSKIYLYEPHPENFKFLKRNLKINKIDDAHPFNYAVLNKKGKSKLFFGEFSYSHSLYMKSESYVFVKTVSLKDIFDDNKINKCDYLKIDAEGSECDIICSLPAEYFSRINIIVFEYHQINSFRPLKKIIKRLSKSSFKILKTSLLYDTNIIIYSKKSQEKFLLFKNLFGYYLAVLGCRKRIFMRNVDKMIGLLGLLLKKNFPKIYFGLKSIEKIH